MQEIIDLYMKWADQAPAHMEALPQAGSNRQYFRLFSPNGVEPVTVIGVYGTSVEENEAFIYMARHFTKRRLPVPQILKVSKNKLCYLQTDMGVSSLYDALEKGRKAGGKYNLHEKDLLKKTIRLLPEFQIRGARGFDFSHCYPQPAFDKTNVLFDLNYFKYCFLKPLEIDFNELKLEATFQLLASDLTVDFGESFMYRDFQARNVMVKDGEPWFIDFQGGRRGPVEYDVASFLWQARAAYPSELKDHLIDTYIESLSRYRKVDGDVFRRGLMHFVLFRTLQVLGAYGFRGYFERKQHFIQSIPAAMGNLRDLLDSGVGENEYPYLVEVLRQLVELPQFAPVSMSADGKLTVRVMSFSYRKGGIPEDNSGNGGGFVFDCRAMHNPGRYEQYKGITGADAPVIEFLEAHGEVQQYLEHVYGLVDPAVQNYVERGFLNLMVAFGCTGGQHRSLYCANHLAEHLKQKYGGKIHIVLEHREQKIRKEL